MSSRGGTHASTRAHTHPWRLGQTHTHTYAHMHIQNPAVQDGWINTHTQKMKGLGHGHTHMPPPKPMHPGHTHTHTSQSSHSHPLLTLPLPMSISLSHNYPLAPPRHEDPPFPIQPLHSGGGSCMSQLGGSPSLCEPCAMEEGVSPRSGEGPGWGLPAPCKAPAREWGISPGGGGCPGWEGGSPPLCKARVRSGGCLQGWGGGRNPSWEAAGGGPQPCAREREREGVSRARMGVDPSWGELPTLVRGPCEGGGCLRGQANGAGNSSHVSQALLGKGPV